MTVSEVRAKESGDREVIDSEDRHPAEKVPHARAPVGRSRGGRGRGMNPGMQTVTFRPRSQPQNDQTGSNDQQE